MFTLIWYYISEHFEWGPGCTGLWNVFGPEISRQHGQRELKGRGMTVILTCRAMELYTLSSMGPRIMELHVTPELSPYTIALEP